MHRLCNGGAWQAVLDYSLIRWCTYSCQAQPDHLPCIITFSLLVNGTPNNGWARPISSRCSSVQAFNFLSTSRASLKAASKRSSTIAFNVRLTANARFWNASTMDSALLWRAGWQTGIRGGEETSKAPFYEHTTLRLGLQQKGPMDICNARKIASHFPVCITLS